MGETNAGYRFLQHQLPAIFVATKLPQDIKYFLNYKYAEIESDQSNFRGKIGDGPG